VKKLLSIAYDFAWTAACLCCCILISVSLAAASISDSERSDEKLFTTERIAMPDNLIVLDRHGEMLRFFPDESGTRHLWTSGKDIPDQVKKAFISIEDERFFSHSGVDLRSVIRALRDNVFHTKVVSGASTISQQVARLMYPRARTLKGKLSEMNMSSELEDTLSKDEILEQYLNRVPLGPRIAGVGLAARRYFGKTPSELSLAEAATLAALPKAPSRLNPHGKNLTKLLERRDIVLKKMLALGHISPDECARAHQEPLRIQPPAPYPNEAPHLVELLKQRNQWSSGIRKTTLDLSLQREVEQILLSHKGLLAARQAKQASAIVIHNPTMEVLASAGSVEYSPIDGGFNNGTTARRSAGSTLKPFLYAFALERGYTASSLLEDILRPYKTHDGFYSPDNFDRHEYGPVTLRTALGNSLNISSVKLLEAVRVDDAFDLMQQLELLPPDIDSSADFGVGLAIGNAEVTLEGLTTAYAALANQGIFRPANYIIHEARDQGKEVPVFSEQAAYIVTDILSDPVSRLITFGRALSFPYKVAVKTGTSTNFRDAWAIGYTPEYTVGIWAGNFEGSPTEKMSGAGSAVPILRKVFKLLYPDSAPGTFEQPSDIVSVRVCGISGMLPGPHCTHHVRELFIQGSEPTTVCSFHKETDHYHKLPTTYAGWLHDRNERGAIGSYRLEGFSSDLASVFNATPDTSDPFADRPSIRVRRRGTTGDVRNAKQLGNLRFLAKPLSNNIQTALVRITYPHPDDRFILAEMADNTIKLQSMVSAPIPYIDWFIDGVHESRTAPPYQIKWTLQKGRHRIMAVGPDRKGDAVEIIVE